jgi:alginate O-acetyltransferase complex protein AlgJ
VTPDAPRPPSRFAAAALVAVLGVGFAATLANPALRRAPDLPVRTGAWAAAYQQALDEASPLRPWAVAGWNALDLALFRQAPDGVVVGAEGWLFTDEEYAATAAAEAHRTAWVARIDEAAARVEAEGVALLVALVPAKAVLVDGGQPPLPDVARDRYDATLADLAALGVRTVDLRPALSALDDDAWLRTDTHWTPEGAQAAADAIAAALLADVPDVRGTATYERAFVGVEAIEGDLVRLLGLGPLEDALAPDPDVIELSEARSSAPPPSDLFAPVDLPVAVVGTSYAADPRWNLADRLRTALGRDVLDAASEGVGPLRPLLDYLDGAAWASARPRAVVWEVPVRYLTDDAFLTPRAAP